MKLLSCLAVVLVLAVSTQAGGHHHDADHHGHHHGNFSVKGSNILLLLIILYSHDQLWTTNSPGNETLGVTTNFHENIWFVQRNKQLSNMKTRNMHYMYMYIE